jgi:hypothetical protein
MTKSKLPKQLLHLEEAATHSGWNEKHEAEYNRIQQEQMIHENQYPKDTQW